MPPSKEFEVERIVSDKFLVGKRFFFVKWRGFDSAGNTWEPEENLANCPKLVREYFSGKGLRNTKARNISTTLMRSLKASKTRRSSILALTSPKASPRGSRRTSLDSPAAKANILQLAKVDEAQPVATKNAQFAKIDELQPAKVEPAKARDLQTAEADHLQPAEASDVLPAEADDVLPGVANDLQPIKTNNLQPAEANDSQPAEANFPNTSFSGRESESAVSTMATPPVPSQQSVDQKVDISGVVATSSAKQPSRSSERGKQLSSTGMSMMVPKIELVRIDDTIELDIKKAQLRQLGLVVADRSPKSSPDLTSSPSRKSKRTRRSASYLRDYTVSRSLRERKPIITESFSVVDLTTSDETSFSSAHERSWQHSTTIERKFSNKLQVRLFDRTPRPEVLTSVPFLENFESDPEPISEWVTEDSDKENMSRKRLGRPAKKGRGQPTKKPKTSGSDRRVAAARAKKRKSEVLAAAEIPVKDLPKSEEAMALLTEENRAGGSNFVMYFPRLKLIKSIPEKMADKYYSQAVIDYYRRSMQPQGRVARRSL